MCVMWYLDQGEKGWLHVMVESAIEKKKILTYWMTPEKELQHMKTFKGMKKALRKYKIEPP